LRDCAGGVVRDFLAQEPEVNGSRTKLLGLWLVLVAGLAGIWRLQQGIDAQLAGLHQEADDLVLRSGPMLKMMSLEYAPLVADLYWTRIVQYYGDKRVRHDPNLDLLWPLLDVTTTLDPNLIPPYRFGSIFLAEPQPRGANKPELAVKFLQRGIRANPDEWRLYEDLGFVYYFNLHDYEKAGAAFLEGSRNPNAKIWMKILAAKVTEQGETRETSMFLWNEIYNSATNDELKQNALTHMRLLKAQADCDALDKVIAEYSKRTGHAPTEMQDLVRIGLLPQVPVDPVGVPYVINNYGQADLDPDGDLAKEQWQYQKPLA
jgi:tetratricopeptide (TPR) repeat protein